MAQTIQRLSELASVHRLDAISSTLISLVEPCVVFSASTEDEGAHSHFGGEAAVEADAWPTRDGEPMVCLLELDLDDLPLPELPKTGLLSVFGVVSPGPDTGVLSFDDFELVHQASPPERGYSAGRTLPRLDLTIREQLSLPSPESVQLFERLRELEAAEQGCSDEAFERVPFERYQQLLDDWGGRRFHHAVLGYPSPCQDDPVGEAARKDRGLKPPFDASTLAEIYADARENWRLLLQVGSDRRAGFDILTGGVAYLAIPRADLEGQRLDAATCVVQR